MKILIAFLITFNLFANNYKCGEHPNESPKYTWTHLSDVDVSAVIAGLQAKLCVGLLNDQIEIVTYRNDRGAFLTFMVEELRNGTVVLLNGDAIGSSMVRKGPLMTLNIANETNTTTYQQQTLELKFHRNLKSSGKADMRVMKFKLKKEHNDDELLSFYTTPKSDEFNTIGIRINLGLKVREIQLRDFNINRVRIDTAKLDQVSTL